MDWHAIDLNCHELRKLVKFARLQTADSDGGRGTIAPVMQPPPFAPRPEEPIDVTFPTVHSRPPGRAGAGRNRAGSGPATAGKGDALSPEKAGIAVYPGAKADAGTTSFVRESLQMTAAAYRTGDDVAKVAAFYAGQAGTSRMGDATKESAGFLAGCKDEYNAVMKKNMQRCGYQVTIQNPWMDMKSGKMVSDTLITIVKQ
jgi:hypothetical protein